MNPQTRSSFNRENDVERKADETMNKAKDKTNEMVNEVVNETKSLVDEASRQAKTTITEQKDVAAGQLTGLAEALRQTSDQLRGQDQGTFASYSNQMADRIEHMSGYLRDHDLDALLHEAENFARRQPELFIGGAFTVGLLAARFLKSSTENKLDDRRMYSTEYNRNTAVSPTYRSAGRTESSTVRHTSGWQS